jgi:hypothetical protein
MQQTGPGAVCEHRVLAGAQAEHLLQDLDALPHRQGVGEGAEYPVALVRCTAEEAQPRVFMAGQQQVGIGLVVPEQDVVLGRQALDQVVFQQQGFRLGAGHRGLDVADARHHVADAGG